MRNVVLITLDGVRWDEFFAGSPVLPAARPSFPRFWARHAERFTVYGDNPTSNRMSACHPSLVSLPGYQTLLSGRVQRGADNDCGRVPEETVLERVARELGAGEVAAFASWEKVALAAARQPGGFLVDAGPAPGDRLPPWPECRWDERTLALALDHLRRRRPRLLYVSLGDSDDWGHAGNLEGYHGALLRYDEWLDGLVAELEAMRGYGERATVVVTTDHGRGAGEDWAEHGAQWPHSERIWLVAAHLGPSAPGPGRPRGRFDQRDLRPTLEALLGLRPLSGEGRGAPLEALLAPSKAPALA